MELSSYFQRYLQAIQPARSSRERAIQLHTTLRKRLEADPHFQDWFAGTFLYGSYRRNTAIKQIKDVDVCVLLNIPPDDANYRPQTVVDRLRRVLERNGYEAKTALQRRSVRIDMSGTTLDVVPVAPYRKGSDLLYIPDRPLARWIPTYPREHLDTATAINKGCNGRFIPLVKIVKAWHRYQQQGVERPKPKGFTLEALVAAYQDRDAPSYAEAFIAFLERLDDDCGHQFAGGSFPQVPDPGKPGQFLRLRISPDEAKRFGRIVRVSLAQARKALEAIAVAESANAWRDVLGTDFPVQPSNTRAAFSTVEEEEDAEAISLDDILEREAREIELPALPKQTLKISARLSSTKHGQLYQHYPSNGRALPKNWWLRFRVEQTSVAQPYDVRWTVENHGLEAQQANDMGHSILGTSTKWEHTKYRGSHSMICELLRNGTVYARAIHIVNVR